MSTREWFISGLVQGVGFRYFVMGEAVRLGLCGYVKNLPDSRVKVVVQGDDASLNKLKKICRQGPPSSRVSEVDETSPTVTEEFSSFEIRY